MTHRSLVPSALVFAIALVALVSLAWVLDVRDVSDVAMVYGNGAGFAVLGNAAGPGTNLAVETATIALIPDSGAALLMFLGLGGLGVIGRKRHDQ